MSRWVRFSMIAALLLAACGAAPNADRLRAAALCDSPASVIQVGQSEMEPTLGPGDTAAFEPLGPGGPHRGDVIAINWRAWTGDDVPNAPSRVIGLPGDHVELRGGTVVLNGAPLAEPYLNPGEPTNPIPGGASSWDVPRGALFVLGDHRIAAADSRSTYGFLPSGALMGRVVFRCAPADRRGPIAGGIG
jgi:signal peptidase I